jgi:hypothetical protein
MMKSESGLPPSDSKKWQRNFYAFIPRYGKDLTIAVRRRFHERALGMKIRVVDE